jgi:outer membrane receptor protein involved in Fe transport
LQLIGGIRFQSGSYRLENEQSWLQNNFLNSDLIDRVLFPFPPATLTDQELEADSLRLSPYLYGYWHVYKQLCLIGGFSYDYQSLPENTLFAPLDSQTKIQRQFSPKAGLMWTPDSRTTIRGAYAQSLTGDNLDQSLRLEPSEIAGFPTTFREVMPASLVGGIGGESVETADVALQRRFGAGTYISLSAGYLHSRTDQSVGAFSSSFFSSEAFSLQEQRRLSFQERWMDVSVHQLLGNYFSVGANYRLSQDHLNSTFTQLNPILGAQANSAIQGTLGVLSLDGIFQLPCGIFASMQGQWWQQNLSQDLSSVPGDHFWQLNAEIGYRSPRRRVQISVGFLNITDQDYRLHPINLYPDLPRSRTLALKLQLNF